MPRLSPHIVLFFVCGHLLSGQIVSDTVLVDSAGAPWFRIDEQTGYIHAIWISAEEDSLGYYRRWIEYGCFDHLGSPLFSAQRISKAGAVFHPRLALGEDAAFCIWSRPGNFDASEICGIYFQPGDTIDSDNKIELAYNDNAAPDVSRLSGDTFIGVWMQESGRGDAPWDIWGQFIDPTGALLDTPLVISDHDSGSVGWPGVATSPTGERLLTAWSDDRTGENRIYGRIFHADGSSLDSSFLISEDSLMGDVFHILQVATNPLGGYAVIWNARLVDGENVVELRFLAADGTPLGPSIKVNDSPEGVFIPSVDLDYDTGGTLTVIWEQHDIAGLSRIRCQRFRADGTRLGPNFQVSTRPDTSHHYWPSLALHEGKIYTAWGASGAVWYNIIDFNNPPLGTGYAPEPDPTRYRLFGNYPNPFNPVSTIRYDLPKASNVSLIVYDILGREVARLVNGYTEPGYHQAQWNGQDQYGRSVPSGIYIARLATPEYTKSIKMLLLK